MGAVAFKDLITFTRSTGGGRFNASGQYEWLPANTPRIDYDPVTGECKGLLVEDQRTNLLTYSGQLGNWLKASGITVTSGAAPAPDGKATASLLATDGTNAWAHISQNTSATGTVTFSAFVKKAATDQIALRVTGTDIGGAGFGDSFYTYTFSTNAWTRNSGGTASKTSIENVGGGWVRVSVTFSTTSASTCFFYPSRGSASVASVYVWQPQFEAGAFPASLIPTPATFTGRSSTATYFDASGVLQTAAADVARYSHAYIDGRWVPTGLVLEGQATNLLTYSSDFANAVWVKDRATIEPAAVISPDGTASASLLRESTAAGLHNTGRGNLSVDQGKQYTASVFAKSASGNRVLRFALFGAVANIDLDTLEHNAFGSSSLTVTATKAANGFTRVAITVTAGTDSSMYLSLAQNISTASNNYTGDGTSGIYIWGAQLEQSSQPTSYIPTTTAQVTRAADTSTSAQVTRAADAASVNTLSPWFNASEGTLVIEAQTFATAGFPRFVHIASDFYIYATPSTSRISLNGRGNPDFAGIASPPLQGIKRIAVAFDGVSATLAVNGQLNTTNIARTGVVSSLDIAAGSQRLNGHYKSIRYFPRKFSDSELQALTA